MYDEAAPRGARAMTEPSNAPERPPSKLQAMLAEYGPPAVITYFVIAALTYAGCWIALSSGLEFAGIEIGEGPWAMAFAAWVALKATQPLRIGATLLVTPLAAKLAHRMGSGR